MFGLGHTRVLIRTDRSGARQVLVRAGWTGRGRPDPLAARIADFLADLPLARGTVTIRRVQGGVARLAFSRHFGEALAQRVRNYVLSLSSR